ncbi:MULTISPECIES: transcriptional regulator Spx [Kandleria]|jgi:regulatory protein spx|uniref:Regulatory protein Spx n=2 Tax=Kandleria vitulina TaxID=1630 RepID=A0A0R2H8T6_9FIRM|nr:MULTISPECIES: transcriptional regulator Spx [Kandleria]KRN49201.1 regulatory protein Spx [Kandleria vitulina DSM 20405]MBP3275742.1 transcriptional regulator Spx [Kandleria sp.]MEE0987985.1 transcriptional regulator Spx [Kandleria vitulina]SDW34406.1 regulatory protein spx [Kandleria vitulina]SEJ29786.1 regulatory protein spx [Kandleria vitulina]
MIRIYTAPSCASCRKVKAWLNEHDIPYVEKNIFSTLLRKEELQELLERSENGTEDIISKRSKIMKENKVNIEDMSINELIAFIQDNPSVLKRPIIIDERRFQVGYNSEEIRAFIPRELRQLAQCDHADFCPPFAKEYSLKEAYERDHKQKKSSATL